MTIDHYLTTEPEPSEDWVECETCGDRKPSRQMFLVGRFPVEAWACNECCGREIPEPDPEEWAACDCCGRDKPYHQMSSCQAYGIDTWACDECRGIEEEEDDGPLLTQAELQERTREMLAPCTDLARRQGCTCSMDPYAYEEVRISRSCPLHGSPAPEYEYEDRDAR